MNAEREARRESERRGKDQLYYELIHNLVLETTRMGIEVKNLKMRLESVSSRLEFNERRARALESAVVYRPSATDEPPPRPAPQPVQQQRYSPPPQQARQHSHTPPSAPAPVAPPPTNETAAAAPATNGQTAGQPVPGEGPGQRSRRRRRRRGRRGGGAATTLMGAAGGPADPAALTDASEQMDAMDRMDDDGAPEVEESHTAAVDNIEQALCSPAQRVEPIVDAAPAADAPTAPAQPEPASGSSPDSSPRPSSGPASSGSEPDAQ
jgi:hypothetical protein